jgi:outer membrane putative beta-barrel porin/alpha-amylase
MRARYLVTLVAALTAATCGIARADHPTVGFSAEIAGPAVTIPAATLPKGEGAVAVRLEYVKFRRFSDSQLAEFAVRDIDAHSTDLLLSPSLGVGYGVTDDFTVSARLPYLLRTAIRHGHLEDGEALAETHGDSQGVGDLTLLGQYRFLNGAWGGLESALLFGIKAPTGDTGERDREGERFEAEHQPGSGSWDPLLGLALSRRLGPCSLDGNLLYTFATKGTQRTDLGDRLHYNAAVSYRLGAEGSGHHSHSHETPAHRHVNWDLILELNGEWQGKQRVAGVSDPNSGGNLIYLSPGFRMSDGSWGATVSVGVPVLQDLNGVQHDTELRLVLGLSKGF